MDTGSPEKVFIDANSALMKSDSFVLFTIDPITHRFHIHVNTDQLNSLELRGLWTVVKGEAEVNLNGLSDIAINRNYKDDQEEED